MDTPNPTDEGARMNVAELASRVRPLLDHHSPGWNAVIDGYPSAVATHENLVALWAYAVGVGYVTALEADVEAREAADLAFRAARDVLAKLGYRIDAGQEEL